MDHLEARGLASLAQDEALPQDKERELAVHLVSCADCKAYFEGLARVRAELRQTPAMQPDEHAIDRAVYRATTVLAGRADPGPLERPLPAAERTDEVVLPREPSGDGSSGQGLPFEEVVPAKVPRRERRAAARDARGRTRRGPWLVALAATVAVAALAALLITQGPAVRDRISPPKIATSTLRARVGAAFDDVRTLEATYTVTRLGLYRQDAQRILFSNATETGRVVTEPPGRIREERTLSLPGGPSKTTAVQNGNELRTLIEDQSGRRATVSTNLPLGPPDGPVQPRLGRLEQTIGVVARMLESAGDLTVLERGTYQDRDVWRVRFSVTPDEFTRADRIDANIDARTYFPLRVERTIARSKAGVLGPGTLLTPAALDAAFGSNTRTTTELVEIGKLTLGEDVLPGEFVLSPADVQPQTTDMHWQRISRAELEGRIPFDPILPSSPPPGFRDTGAAVLQGKAPAWGPRGQWPAPDAVMQASYSDGETTIVLSERRIPRRRDAVTGSPLQPDGALPIVTRKIVRSGLQLEYAVSQDVPPHVYGFIGDVYVVAAGYATQEDLLRLMAALASPTASASPGASGSPGPSPSASPAATTRPR